MVSNLTAAVDATSVLYPAPVRRKRRRAARRFEEKAGQARDIESVGRTGFSEDECIRMANGLASSY
jgi:hypothetical protein